MQSQLEFFYETWIFLMRHTQAQEQQHGMVDGILYLLIVIEMVAAAQCPRGRVFY